ncbi:MAG: S-layer family protein [Cyanobacteria bacterium P01_A01_bin.80]
MDNTLNWLQKLLFFGCLVFCVAPVKAQIAPDNTLDREASRVTPNVLINSERVDRVDGGAQRGSNLFHSFSQFNIDNGQRVYFSNPSGVENILTRVTGGDASNILGTLGVNGNANLFLINPNGIVFGENARLDVRGSFVVTTANGLQFGQQGAFSATNPETPGLLTVNPNALFLNQLQANVGTGSGNISGIINKSQAPAGINPEGDETTGLRVPSGESLLLVGGNINSDGGSLRAYKGRVELASFAAPGIVGLDISGNKFSLNVPGDAERGDVSLRNKSAISIFGAGGGDIVINARNLEISNSSLFAGIGKNSENPQAQAGDVNLNTTGSIFLKDGAFVSNSVRGQGNAGDININADSLSLTEGSEINAKTLGIGNAGDINVNTSQGVSLDGFGRFTLSDGSDGTIPTRIINSVDPEAVGNAGDIQLNTGNLWVSNEAFISSGSNGKGDAGNIIINSRDRITFSDLAGVKNVVDYNTMGNGGDIRVKTGELLLKNGGSLDTINAGQGNAGNVFLDVRDTITFDGTGSNGIPSSVNTSVTNGNAGNIDVRTGSLFLANGGQMNASGLILENSNRIANSNGIANAANITINARDAIKIDGANSGLFTFLSNGAGKGGDIEITTGSLSVTNSALLLAVTAGKGNAGNININASDTVNFDQRSFASTSVVSNAIGEGGDIKIKAGLLSVTNDASLSTLTFGSGNAGNININASDTVNFDKGGFVSALTSGNGDAGNITINASDTVNLDNRGFISTSVSSDAIGDGGDIQVKSNLLSISNNSFISASTSGQGNAGILNIDAASVQLDNQASLDANTRSPNRDSDIEQATINLNSNSLILRRNSNITTEASGENVIGGNINIDSDVIAGFENSDISANSTNFRGGRVGVDTQGIFGIQPRNLPTLESDITATGANPDLSGSTDVDNLDVDPSQGTIELPVQFEDKSNQIGQVCPRTTEAARKIGSFTVTGRGALTPSPLKPLAPKANLSQLATLDEDGNTTGVQNQPSTQENVEKILEAQEFVKDSDGSIYLVARTPRVTANSHPSTSVCSTRKYLSIIYKPTFGTLTVTH